MLVENLKGEIGQCYVDAVRRSDDDGGPFFLFQRRGNTQLLCDIDRIPPSPLHSQLGHLGRKHQLRIGDRKKIMIHYFNLHRRVGTSSEAQMAVLYYESTHVFSDFRRVLQTMLGGSEDRMIKVV